MTSEDQPHMLPHGNDGQRAGQVDLSGLPRPELPQQVRAALTGDLEAHLASTPARGEVWRLEFDGIIALVLVTGRTDDELRVVPVGEDPHMADLATLIIDEPSSPLGFSVGLWVALETTVPTFVVDRKLGSIDAVDQVSGLRRWVQVGDEPEGIPARVRGGPVTSDLDSRIDYRNALREPLERLAATRHLLDAPAPEPERSLRELLTDADLTPADLRDMFGWPQNRVVEAFRDSLVLDPIEAAQIAEQLGVDVDAVLAATTDVNPRLLVVLHQPEHRPQVHRWADQQDLPDVVGRRQAAQQIMASRQRRVGDIADEPNWQQLVNDFFEHG